METQLIRTNAELIAAQDEQQDHALQSASHDNDLAQAKSQVKARDETIMQLQSELEKARAEMKELRKELGSTKRAMAAAVLTTTYCTPCLLVRSV